MRKIIAVLFLIFTFVSCTVAAKQAHQTYSPLEDIPTNSITIFGELHGTNEAPKLVGDYAYKLALEKKEVVVALEIVDLEQVLIDAFLRSQGASKDIQALLNGAFWKRDMQDGRSSKAMLALLERIRELKSKGAKIRVMAVDQTIDGSRDEGMASLLRATHIKQPKAKIIALFGNFHSGKAKGTSWDSNYEPVAYRLLDLQPLSIHVDSRGGDAWLCNPDCGVMTRNPKVNDVRKLGYTSGESWMPGYDGTYLFERSTASEPAISK